MAKGAKSRAAKASTTLHGMQRRRTRQAFSGMPLNSASLDAMAER